MTRKKPIKVRKRVTKTKPLVRAQPKLKSKPKLKTWLPDEPMSRNQYLAAIDQLGLTTASQRTAKAIGVSVRRAQRFASGDSEVPLSVKRLLEMYLTHGLPDDVQTDEF